MNYSFFAMLSRMKYIDRWALMRNTRQETLDTHSKEVAVIAQALAIIGNRRFGKNYNPDRAAVLGLFHDAHEILTGDMPTPVKYQNPEILSAFKDVEALATDSLISLLPSDMREDYSKLLTGESDSDKELLTLVKAADKISALIKCVEERKAGNSEFKKAEAGTKKKIRDLKIPEADVFVEEFLPAFELTLDQLQ